MNTATNYPVRRVPELLQGLGARVVGRGRANCPRCAGLRTLSFNTEVFHCFHDGCGYRGNSFTLARELGLLEPKQRSAKERRHWRDRERRVAEARDWLLAKIRERRQELLNEFHSLATLETLCRGQLAIDARDEQAWEGLQHVYSGLPPIQAELAILNESRGSELISFILSNDAQRRERIECVVSICGLQNHNGKFIEVDYGV